MNNWLNYLLSVQEGGNEGTCPCCGGNSLSAGFVLTDADTKRGHGSLWCNDCKHAYHLSRMIISENLPIIEDYPPNLIY